MPDPRLTTSIDEDRERYFDLRDYTPDDTGMNQHFGTPVQGPWLTTPGKGVSEAEMRQFLATTVGYGWSPAQIDAAIAAAMADTHGRG